MMKQIGIYLFELNMCCSCRGIIAVLFGARMTSLELFRNTRQWITVACVPDCGVAVAALGITVLRVMLCAATNS